MVFAQLCVLMSLFFLTGKSGIVLFSWLQYHKAFMAKYTLHSEWQQARLLAVTHHMSLVYCGSDDGLHCSSSWRRGRLLMTADRHHVIWYHQDKWNGLRWQQGVIMQ